MKLEGKAPVAISRPTLIASDVDGTLIDDENRVSEYTKTILANACAAGAEFVLATGRPPRWIAEITDQFDPSRIRVRHAVCANGAILYDVEHDRIISSATLAPEILVELGAIAQAQIPGCGIAAERVGRSAHDAATAPFVATAGYQHAWLNPDHVEVGDEEIYTEPAVKLLVRAPGMPSSEIAQRLSGAIGDLAQITFSTDNGLVELSLPDIHKASGLRKLLDHNGGDGSTTVAFGDMPNDVEMLTWASHGVAMSHAHPAALAAADEITVGNNEDGVARVLARWFG
ncbi:HAD family hydrolase [Gordonia polyisoprenivorans]|uniref:HAD family hydrolase n=1 Tax=Gordonia polyisoprenivorans TaxID=84595 RepID=UPI000B99E02B|nr:HAD family hydrolase [Gordonia polyisoprenivorans]OZC33367.1 HAD family hydrolase [Gordonia polyisoprenivorans]QUD82376.1 HAD family hydrolase [Gordonia polyisoprenivorans]UZF56784.1 HAD family hydrolase [Gordonia polyisoprenivorans]WCB37854.1 HAD family hydrolase [Gordonia polyisoprenivorans]